MREREILKATKCIRVIYVKEALISMVCELKITSLAKNRARALRGL